MFHYKSEVYQGHKIQVENNVPQKQFWFNFIICGDLIVWFLFVLYMKFKMVVADFYRHIHHFIWYGFEYLMSYFICLTIFKTDKAIYLIRRIKCFIYF